MIALISTIIGLLSSTIPSLIKFFEKRQDYKYELEFRKLEVEAALKGIELQTRIESIKAAVAEANAIYAHDSQLDGGPSINKLRASVRPIITYAFFGMFITIKLVLMATYIGQGLHPLQIASLLWDEQTVSIFSMIIAFWFGSRAIEKLDYINTPNPGISSSSIKR